LVAFGAFYEIFYNFMIWSALEVLTQSCSPSPCSPDVIASRWPSLPKPLNLVFVTKVVILVFSLSVYSLWFLYRIDKEIERRKPCAEGVLSEALDDAEVSPQREFAAHRITGAYLYPPDEKKRVRVGGDGYILDKPAFLTSLSERAGAAGAEVVYGARVESVSR